MREGIKIYLPHAQTIFLLPPQSRLPKTDCAEKNPNCQYCPDLICSFLPLPYNLFSLFHFQSSNRIPASLLFF